jgi:hypothetical protein
MIDITLFIGRILLVALLFLFLFAVMRTGVGMVRGQNKTLAKWSVTVEKGPRELSGISLTVDSPVVIGRSPGADIVIRGDYVSGRHARFSLVADALIVEDLGSTNGTLVNQRRIEAPVTLASGDMVGIGDAVFRVKHD